jgi:hypothetical protein
MIFGMKKEAIKNIIPAMAKYLYGENIFLMEAFKGA